LTPITAQVSISKLLDLNEHSTFLLAYHKTGKVTNHSRRIRYLLVL
jgi:hypothetical protein